MVASKHEMLFDFGTKREERDHYLVVTSVVASAVALFRGFDTWIVEEAQELIFNLEPLAPTLNGTLRRSVEIAVRRLKEIAQEEVFEVKKDARTAVMDVSGGSYDDVVDARRYLEQQIYRFERLASELLRLRLLMDSLTSDDSQE